MGGPIRRSARDRRETADEAAGGGGEVRAGIGRLLARGRADVRKLEHAQARLEADEAEGWTGERIVGALDVGPATVQRLRRRFVGEGFAAALSPYRRGSRACDRKLDGERAAHPIAPACSAPPDGHGRRSLRLLARRTVELEHADVLSRETVRQALKKRAQAALEEGVAHPAEAVGGVRLPHGGCAGGLPPAPRPEASGRVPG